MRLALRLLGLAGALGLGLLAAWPLAHPAAAHPLGNFTINHYDRITPSSDGIELYSVLDLAEIPAFRERQQIDNNADGTIDDHESEAYAAAKIAAMQSQLVLRVDDEDATLVPVDHALTFPAGQGGLSLLRLVVTYRVDVRLASDSEMHTIQFENRNDADRIGWREIVVRGGGGVRIASSSVPSQDASGELTSYPTDSLNSPLDIRTATASFRFDAGAVADPINTPAATAVRGNSDAPLARFASLIAREHLSAGVIVLALLAALGFGALHALSPGHGKTIVAAYLVGSKGTGRHALLLGLTVTLTHTSSVYAMGFIALSLSEFILPERLYPWLTVASGALITTMGVVLLFGRLRSAGALAALRRQLSGVALPTSPLVAATDYGTMPLSTARSDTHDGESHSRAHSHSHAENAGVATPHRHGLGTPHSHEALGPDDAITWRRLIGLGIFGGLLPCPSAIVVMLSAVSLHRIGFGLLLIVAFSFGLAAVLTSIGLAMVYGRSILRRLPILGAITSSHRGSVADIAVRAFPIAAAAAVVVAGCLLTVPALTKL